MEGTAVNTRKGDCPKWFIAGLISLAAQMIACGGSENRAEHDQERIADIGRVLPQEHTVDFNGFIFGRAWVLEVIANDFEWASYLVDRSIRAHSDGDVAGEIRYLTSLIEALEIVHLDDFHIDYREPLFLKSEDVTTLARRLESAGIDTMPARHTAWAYKDGFVKGLIVILEASERTSRNDNGPTRGELAGSEHPYEKQAGLGDR